MRRLCLHLGYVQGEEADHLGNVLPASKHDPLELFKASVVDPTQSRYSVFFQQDTAECDTMRRLFFNNVYGPTVASRNNSPKGSQTKLKILVGQIPQGHKRRHRSMRGQLEMVTASRIQNIVEIRKKSKEFVTRLSIRNFVKSSFGVLGVERPHTGAICFV